MKDEKMVTFSIDTKVLESISKIAKDEGINEESIINEFLNEAVEDYDDCELLERLKKSDAEIRDSKGITLGADEFDKRYGL